MFRATSAVFVSLSITEGHNAMHAKTLSPPGDVYEHRAVRKPLGRPSPKIPRGHAIGGHAEGDFRPGDILGFCGSSLSSAAICAVTYGIPGYSLSHVGIVVDYFGELLVWESTLDCDLPCVIQGRTVQGVQAHLIEPRINEYRGKVWHYPLTRPLYHHEDDRLRRFALCAIGKSYDEIGAFRAGGFGFSLIESRLHEAALNSFFCSELVAACHNEIGIFPTAHVNRWNPNLLVRRERILGLVGRPRGVSRKP